MTGAGPKRGLSTGELARKAVHVGVGLLALLVPWLTWWQGAGICLLAFLMNWLVLPRLTHHIMEREEERRRGFAPGILEYPLSVGALFILFGSRPEVVAAAWGILAFGDGFATLAGRTLGGPRLPWNSDKSVAGFAAFVGVGGTAASLLSGWAFSQGADPGAVAAVTPLMCFAAALLGAFIESLSTGFNDNVSVPLLSGCFLMGLSLADPALLSGRSDALLANLVLGAVVNAVVAGLAFGARTVNLSGLLVGFVIGTAVYAFGGWESFVILMLFFVLASGSTKVGYRQKAARKIAQEEGGRRGARHAVANCGVAAFLAFLAAATPWTDLCLLGLVAALATAAFDTVSSEIGQVYGRHPFLITTFRPVPPGTDGAVSLEGTLAGLCASILLAAAAFGLGMSGALGPGAAAVIVAAAFIGTTVESYMGATVEAMKLVDNEAMNFTNTLVGAASALGLAALVLI